MATDLSFEFSCLLNSSLTPLPWDDECLKNLNNFVNSSDIEEIITRSSTIYNQKCTSHSSGSSS